MALTERDRRVARLRMEIRAMEKTHGKGFLLRSMSSARYRYDALKRELREIDTITSPQSIEDWK